MQSANLAVLNDGQEGSAIVAGFNDGGNGQKVCVLARSDTHSYICRSFLSLYCVHRVTILSLRPITFLHVLGYPIAVARRPADWQVVGH